MSRTSIKVGEAVPYVTETGQHVTALVTAVHGPGSIEEQKEYRRNWAKSREENDPEGLYPRVGDDYIESEVWAQPAINVVYVSADPTKKDPYGVQVERASSVSFKNEYTAHGRYYV